MSVSFGCMRAPSQSLTLNRAFSTSASHAPQTPSPLFDYRRLKIKQSWGKGLFDENIDSDKLSFPRERLGRDYALNWTIASYNFVACNNAFRNLHPRGLRMLTESSHFEKSSKTITIHTNDNFEGPVFFLKADQKGDFPTISEADYKIIFKKARDQLSKTQYVFVTDAAVGSVKSTELGARSFADNSTSAIILRDLLEKIPLKTNPKDFKHPLTIFVAGGLNLGELDELSEKLKSSLSTKNGIVLVDPSRGRVLVAGTVSSQAIYSGLSSLIASEGFAKQSLYLPASLLISGSPSASHLIFGSNSLLNKDLFDSQSIFASNGVFWNADGVSRVFGGRTVTDSQTSGNFVEKLDGKGTRTILPLPKLGHLAPHPTTAIFLSEKDQGVKKLTPEQLAKAFEGISKFVTPVLAENFGNLVSTHKVTGIQIGVSSGVSKQEFQKLMTSVLRN